MNERQLKSFVAAAEMKSFARAAKAAMITSPAVISQINLLEKDTGMSLFTRTTHGIELTSEGQILYKAAKRILQLYDDALEECRELKDGDTLTIALFQIYLRRICAYGFDFKMLHPNMSIAYLHIPEMQFPTALRDGSAQLEYCGEPLALENENYQFIKTSDEIFMVTVPLGHPLFSAKKLTAEDLQPYTVLTWNLPLRRINPAGVLKSLGISCTEIEDEFSVLDYTNILMNGDLLMASSGLFDEENPNFRTIPTDISAGAFGFVMYREPSEFEEMYVEGFLRDSFSGEAI